MNTVAGEHETSACRAYSVEALSVGGNMAKDHYRKLVHNAAACIYCGVCEGNCLFHVGIMNTMREMKACISVKMTL